ncbi:MAG: rhomboid family intramembrane serine protease [Flavobacteriales bacterium]
MLVAQYWIGLAAVELRHVDSVDELATLGPRDHTTLPTPYIDRGNGQADVYVHTSGKHDQYLNFDMYFALPIRTDIADTAGPVVAWLGRKSHYSMSTDASDAEKEHAYQAHVDSSIAAINRAELDTFDHLENLGANDDLEHYEAAVRKSPLYAEGTPIRMFAAHAEPFAERDAKMGRYFLWALLVPLAVWGLILAFLRVRDGQKVVIAPAEEGGTGAWQGFKDVALPRPGFFTTPLLIWANVLVFAAMAIAGLGFMEFDPKDLITWGGDFKPLVLEGQWWRLFTSTFLHGGLLHLLFNMYGLLMVGIFLEPVLGRWWVLGLYVCCGLVASATSLYWHDDQVGVGASGAIFGLYGVLIALLLTGVFERSFTKSLLVSMLFFVGYNLLMGIQGNVDNAAHIGGLVCGLVLGSLTRMTMKPLPPEENAPAV